MTMLLKHTETMMSDGSKAQTRPSPPRKREPVSNQRHSPGVIEPQAVYTREEFIARTGLRDESFRQAVRNGLKVVRRHKRVYIVGQCWINYLASDGNANA